MKSKNILSYFVIVCFIFFTSIASYIIGYFLDESLLISAFTVVLGYYLLHLITRKLEKDKKKKVDYFFYKGCVISAIICLIFLLFCFILQLYNNPLSVFCLYAIPVLTVNLSLCAMFPAINLILKIINDMGDANLGQGGV